MGTTRSSETLALARHLRNQREQTQDQVDAAAESRGAPARYVARQALPAPSAH